MYDYAVIGGGILGLATANELLRRTPGASLVVLEKESGLAHHQTGHNSGVIHAGVYYAPGSLKARLGVAGNASMVEFCRVHGIAHEVCGKVIVATDDGELAALQALFERGTANGLALTMLTADAVREREPHVRCVAGIHAPSTGIADFVAVAHKLAELAAAGGAELRLDAELHAVEVLRSGVRLVTYGDAVEARFMINCAGLQSDRVARLCGVDPGVRIVPFRGEYYNLRDPAARLVRNLIYPVPDPNFPFLGVHLTRAIDGHVHAGPNAVLATSREGYRKRDFRARDLAETLAYRGFRRLAARHLRQGAAELHRSFSKRAFARSLQRLVPELGVDDIVPASGGVRAQALLPDGRLADDFVLVHGERTLHVCNAPSPAATAALEIAREIADRIPSAAGEVSAA